MVLWKHFLGFLAAKASVYEPFYTLEVSCLAGCDSDLINATQAEAKWVPLNLSRGSSLVLNPFRAIHGMLQTQNSKRNDLAILSRHHELFVPTGFHIACPHVPRLRRCAWPLNVTHRNPMLPAGWWRGTLPGKQLCLDDRASQLHSSAWKESENIVKLPSEQKWSLFFFTKLQGMAILIQSFIHWSGGIPLRALLWFHLEVGPHSWMYRPYDQAGHFVSKGSQVTRSRGIVKIVYV